MDYFYRADSPDWPIDTSDHIFLARVCAKLGEAMFGEGWGRDVKLPIDADDGSLAYQEWEVLSDQADIEEEQMIRTVRDQIAAWAQAGQLKMALRAKQGGALVPQSADDWNTERYLHRFTKCEMSPDAPFKIFERGSHYIFVGIKSFEACLPKIARGRQTISVRPKPRQKKEAYKRNATMRIIRELWSTSDVRPGPELLRHKVNQELGKDIKDGVSLSTVKLALKELEGE